MAHDFDTDWSNYSIIKDRITDGDQRGYLNTIKFLENNGLDIAYFPHGAEPLPFIAIDKSLLCVATKIIQMYSSNNVYDNVRWTLLHMAVRAHRTSVVRFLITKHANVNALDVWGQAPLHIAAWTGCSAIAEVLIRGGAVVNIRDLQGRTPLAIALGQSSVETADLLERSGAII
jgi:ankyrin repeat protein